MLVSELLSLLSEHDPNDVLILSAENEVSSRPRNGGISIYDSSLNFAEFIPVEFSLKDHLSEQKSIADIETQIANMASGHTETE